MTSRLGKGRRAGVFAVALACASGCSDRTLGEDETGGTGTDGTTGATGTNTTEGTTSGSSSGATDGGTGGGTGAMCEPGTPDLEVVGTSVMLVVDKSGSTYSNEWDHDGDAGTDPVSRWTSIEAVVLAFSAAHDQALRLGLQLFPHLEAIASFDPMACFMDESPEVGVDFGTGYLIEQAMPEYIQGATPTTAAVNQTLAHFETIEDLGPEYMLLITDGAPNCAGDDVSDMLELYDPTAIDAVAAGAAAGILTHVVGVEIEDRILGCGIGVPTCGTCSGNQAACNNDAECMAGETCDPLDTGGADYTPLANPWKVINELAEAGGVPQAGDTKFRQSLNEAELLAHLEAIGREIVNCEIRLDPPPTAGQALEISVGGTAVAEVADCTAGDGFLLGASGDTVELCGQACTDFYEGGEVEVAYVCPG